MSARKSTKTAQDLVDMSIPEPNTGCWLWLGAVTRGGYGNTFHSGRNFRAHRLMYELTNGDVDARAHVCHRCDMPTCINPAHLFVGSPRENTMDMIAKGRRSTVAGSMNPRAKLTEAGVLGIRRDVADGRTQTQVAAENGVSVQTVNRIVHGHLWAHLERA